MTSLVRNTYLYEKLMQDFKNDIIYYRHFFSINIYTSLMCHLFIKPNATLLSQVPTLSVRLRIKITYFSSIVKQP